MTAPITNSSGSATIGAAEFSLAAATTTGAPTSQTTAAKITPWLDCRTMTSTEQFNVVVYEKVAGGSQAIVATFPIVGASTEIVVLPTFVLMEGWDITIRKIAGTDRAIGWSLRLDQNDGPATIAAIPSAVAIAAAVIAATVEGSITVGRALRGLVRTAFAARRNGYDTGAIVIRDVANTKNSITIAADATGWTAVTLNDLD